MIHKLLIGTIVYWFLIIPMHYNYLLRVNENTDNTDNIESTIVVNPTTKPTPTFNTVSPTSTPIKIITPTPTQISRSETHKGVIFKITAYDLSIDSCGKARCDKYFGITNAGFNLANHTRESAMTIAVDTNVIPMNSLVEIFILNDNYKYMNGIYTARDTGSAIKGNIIDIFMGDFYSEKAHQSVYDFGVQKAYVNIIKGE